MDLSAYLAQSSSQLSSGELAQYHRLFDAWSLREFNDDRAQKEQLDEILEVIGLYCLGPYQIGDLTDELLREDCDEIVQSILEEMASELSVEDVYTALPEHVSLVDWVLNDPTATVSVPDMDDVLYYNCPLLFTAMRGLTDYANDVFNAQSESRRLIDALKVKYGLDDQQIYTRDHRHFYVKSGTSHVKIRFADHAYAVGAGKLHGHSRPDIEVIIPFGTKTAMLPSIREKFWADCVVVFGV
jgi:hypothetical protein